MPWAAAGAAVSAGAGLIGGAMQSGAVKDAQKQANWARQLAVMQEQQNYNTSVNNLAPFYAGGTAATGATTDLLGLNGPDAAATAMGRYQTSPGYTWQLGEGLRAVDAAGAAGKLLPGVRSGATIKAEEAYGQGLANQDFTQYYNRLFDLSKMGATAAAGMNLAGENLSQTILGNATGTANNAMATGTAEANIAGNTASSLGTTLGGLLQNKGVQSTLSGLFGDGYSGPSANTLLGGGGSPDWLQGSLGLASNQYVP